MNTPITQYLNDKGVRYQLLPHASPAISVQDAAQQRGITANIMVKTILLRDMGNLYALACVPGDQSADPKKVRALLQCRRMTCASLDEISNITGYAPGTVTPLLLKTEMPIFFDSKFKKLTDVTISSGTSMAGLMLALDDLTTLCQVTFADITRDS